MSYPYQPYGIPPQSQSPHPPPPSSAVAPGPAPSSLPYTPYPPPNGLLSGHPSNPLPPSQQWPPAMMSHTGMPILSHDGTYGLPQHPPYGTAPAGQNQPSQPYPTTNAASQMSAPPPPSFPAHPSMSDQSRPSFEAIPAPARKADYAPPVFKTFQERRREKQASLYTNAPAAPAPSDVVPRSQTTADPRHGTPLTPAPAAIALMGSASTSGAPPAPPPRSRSPSIPPVLPPSSPSIRTSTQPPPSASAPSPVASRSARPLPRPQTPGSPAIPNSGTRSPLPQSPIQATLERSDTISSVKSLDRSGFTSTRPLPKPPVGVNSSRSLDRGVPSGGMFDARNRRKQPSVVNEEPEEDAIGESIAQLSISARSSPVPTIQTPNSPKTSQPLVKVTNDAKAPAKFTPLPVINVPDSDSSATNSDDETGTQGQTPKAKSPSIRQPPSPGIVLSGLPMIEVSSSDAADESTNGPISIQIPSFSFGDVSEPPARSKTVTRGVGLGSDKPVRIDADSAIICAGCDQPIIGRIVNAMKRRWHPHCFGCAECGELLEHVSSYEHNGKAYCHLDYHDRFAHRCHHCQTPIVDPRFVTLDDPVLGQRFYHELHFFCSECGDPFLDPSRSSAPGTEQLRETDEEVVETSAFVIHKGHPYCERCHIRLHKPKCKACNKPIPDVAINALGAKWHAECFVCNNCTLPFANSLFFPKDGKAYCTSCYDDVIAA